MNKMKQATKAKLLTIISIALLVVIGICNILVSVCNTTMEDALEEKYNMYVYSEQFRTASELLETKARAYAATGDSSRLDDYNNELNVDKNREKAIELIEAMDATDEEIACLEKAMSISNQIAGTEEEANRLAGNGDLVEATALLHTTEYVNYNHDISACIDEFDELTAARMDKQINSASALCTVCDVVTYASIIVAFIFQIYVMNFVLRELIRPILKIEEKMGEFLEGDMSKHSTLLLTIPRSDRPQMLSRLSRSIRTILSRILTTFSVKCLRVTSFLRQDARKTIRAITETFFLRSERSTDVLVQLFPKFMLLPIRLTAVQFRYHLLLYPFHRVQLSRHPLSRSFPLQLMLSPRW